MVGIWIFWIVRSEERIEAFDGESESLGLVGVGPTGADGLTAPKRDLSPDL
jgi:hypothetical protein